MRPKIRVLVALRESQRQAFAAEAISARLFVPGWTLRKSLVRLRDRYRVGSEIALLVDESPQRRIAVGVVVRDVDGNINIYVKPAYRLKGYGTELMRSLHTAYPSYHFNGGPGVGYNLEFFSKVSSRLQMQFSTLYTFI